MLMAFIERDEIIGISVIALGLGIGAIIYFLPTIIASRKRHPSGVSIFILNLFAGWTVAGWVVAMIWVFSFKPRRRY